MTRRGGATTEYGKLQSSPSSESRREQGRSTDFTGEHRGGVCRRCMFLICDDLCLFGKTGIIDLRQPLLK
jgi:hypothetical protein